MLSNHARYCSPENSVFPDFDGFAIDFSKVDCEIKSFGYNYKIRLFLPVLLKNLRLINFKNYADQSVEFKSPFTAIVGPNGSGKTSLLEALHYLALTKSLAGSGDVQNIRTGESFFSLMGEFENDGHTTEVRLSVESSENGVKKELQVNGKECRRFADHIGRFPVVSLVPRDIELIWESGEIRRKFFDQWMSQTDRNYLEDLIRYQHLLKNRNALLRSSREGAAPDQELLKFYSDEMNPPATRIHAFRRDFIQRISPAVNGFYSKLIQPESSVTGKQVEPSNPEDLNIRFTSDLDAVSFDQLLEQTASADLKAGRTTAGPHLDDYHFELNGGEVRKFGSQGQQKSVLVALKLTMFHVLKEMTHISPILMLDDIFDKMDDHRIKNLLAIVSGTDFGQVILTDSSPGRAGEKLEAIRHAIMRVENGKIQE